MTTFMSNENSASLIDKDMKTNACTLTESKVSAATRRPRR